MLRRPPRLARWFSALLVVAAAVSACGGFPDRKGVSAAIAAAVGELPGVSKSDPSYQNDFTNGASFYLHVTLADDATPAEAATVGRTFVDRIKAADFARYDVELDVEYRRVDDLLVNAPNGGYATISYAFDEDGTVGATGEQVADTLKRWLTIAQNPVVSAARVQQPLRDARMSAPRGFTVALAPSADDQAVRGLIDAQPELAQATWQIVAGPATAARIYTVRGVFPDRQRRTQWERIVATLGADGSIEARTDTVDLHSGQAATDVTITIAPLALNPSDLVRSVAAELPLLGPPVRARFFLDKQAVAVTLGGCTRSDRDYPASPLQTELRQRYERC